MGNELFGVDIAGIIADEVGDGLLDVELTIYERGNRTPGNLTGGRSKTPVDPKPVRKGFWEDYTPNQIDGDQIQLNDRKAVLIGGTIPAGVVVAKGDKITIEGATLTVQRLQSRDPAAAVYTYQCRDTAGADGK